MPDIKLDNQPFDLAFHPSSSTVYTALLTGEIKAFSYSDDSGSSRARWSARPSKRSVRSVVVQEGGGRVWATGKAGGVYGLDPESGKTVDDRPEAHAGPVNRIANCFANLFVTGDDEGVIKLWDHRKPAAIREYRHHWEYISDFMFLEDKKQLVCTSGDGTLSVLDIRGNTTEPVAVSEDQDDELLSVVSIKGGTKSVVGSQLGVLSMWDRQKGWGDCIDRIPGHPASVETLVALTPDIVATGSEDGLIRVMQLYPNKFLGVIASHDDFPIERIKLDRNAKWLGSVSHDEVLKLTDVSDLFEDSDAEDDGEGDEGEAVETGGDEDAEMTAQSDEEGGDEDQDMEDSDSDSDGEVAAARAAKRDKKKDDKGLRAKLAAPNPKKEPESGSFFDDL